MPEHNKYLFADISKNENSCLFSIILFLWISSYTVAKFSYILFLYNKILRLFLLTTYQVSFLSGNIDFISADISIFDDLTIFLMLF